MLIKKAFIALITIVFFGALGMAQIDVARPFFSSAVNVDAGATKTNGSTLTSLVVPVVKDNVAMTMEFSRGAGTADTLDIELEGRSKSTGDTDWSILRNTSGVPMIQVATGTDVITGTTVRLKLMFNFYGIKRLRVRSIHNGDSVNNVTAIQLTLNEK